MFIRTSTGDVIEVGINFEKEIVSLTQKKTSVGISKQQLYYRGKVLEDKHTISSYNLLPNPSLQLCELTLLRVSVSQFMYPHHYRCVSVHPRATTRGGGLSGEAHPLASIWGGGERPTRSNQSWPCYVEGVRLSECHLFQVPSRVHPPQQCVRAHHLLQGRGPTRSDSDPVQIQTTPQPLLDDRLW